MLIRPHQYDESMGLSGSVNGVAIEVREETGARSWRIMYHAKDDEL